MKRNKHKEITLLLIIICLLGITILCVFISHFIPSAYVHNDFYDYWIGSSLYWSGNTPYGITDKFKLIKDTYNLQFHWATGYSYPPFLAWAFYPFIQIHPITAAWIWFILNTILYGIFCYHISNKYQSRMMLLYLFTFSPVLYSIGAGQINIFILIALYLYISRPTHIIGIFGLSIAGIIKVYPFALFFIQCIRKQWKVLIKTIGIGITLLLIPIIPLGFSTTFEYLFNVLPKLQNSTENYFAYQSFNAFISRLPVGDSSHIIHQIFTAGMIILLIWFSLKIQNHWHITSLWITGLTLVAGTTTFWNFTPTLLGNLFFISHWKELTKIQRSWFVFSIICSNIVWHGTFLFNGISIPQNPGIRIIYAFGMSVGFIYGIIQFALLATFKSKTTHPINHPV